MVRQDCLRLRKVKGYSFFTDEDGAKRRQPIIEFTGAAGKVRSITLTTVDSNLEVNVGTRITLRYHLSDLDLVFIVSFSEIYFPLVFPIVFGTIGFGIWFGIFFH